MKEEQINLLITTSAKMDVMYKDISELSKKNPHESINKFKLKFINKILSDANSILKNGSKPFEEFDNFDEDDLPSNSDIIIILSQYRNAIEKLRCENIIQSGDFNWYWVVDGKLSEIKTTSPSLTFKRR